jgi:hypothetical protein
MEAFPLRRLAAILALLLAFSPIAAASSVIDAGVAVVVVQDERGTDCSPSIGPTCQAAVNLDPTSPGHTSANVSQNINYVGVATNTGSQPTDINKSVRSSDLYIHDPIVPLVSETWMANRPNTSAYTNDSIVMDSNSTGFEYYGPALADPTGPNDTRGVGLSYKGGSGPGIEYSEDQIGPFLVPNTPGNDTNHYYDQPAEIACHDFLGDAPACYGPFAPVSDAGKSNTPDVWWGFSWDDVQAANNRSDLTLGSKTPAVAPEHGRPHDSPPDGNRTEDSSHHDAAPTRPPMPGPPHHAADSPPPNQGARVHVQHASGSPLHLLPPPPNLVTAAEIIGGAVLFIAGFLAFYTRFAHQRDMLLRHPVRAELIRAIREQPGSTVSDLARAVGCSHMLAAYHIDKLARGDYVRKVKGKQRVCVYPIGMDVAQLPPGFMPIMAAIMRVLRHAPDGMSRRALSAQLANASDSTRRKAIRRLMAWGWIIEEPTSKNGHWVLRVATAFSWEDWGIQQSVPLSKERTSSTGGLLPS